MSKLSKQVIFITCCCLLLAAGIPLQTGITAQRVVLMELMSATWCPYCPTAEEAMYTLAAQYGSDQVAAIEYHPTSSYWGTAETQARINWYFSQPGSWGYPTMFFDGYESVVGGGVPMIPYYQPIINTHLTVDSPISMSNTGYIGATSGEVTTHIEVEWLQFSPVKLRFALIEHDLYYNRDYNYVCRDLLPEETLVITTPGQTFDVTRTFTIDPSWNADNMDIVTFVQYDPAWWIVQSAMGFTNVAGDVVVTLTPYGAPIVIPANGGSFDFNIAITNNEATPWTFDVWTDVTLPNGSIYGPIIGPLTVTIPSITVDRDRTQVVPGTAPSGTYSYNAYVGNYPDDVWSSDSFTFEKSTTSDGGAVIGDWFCDGESFTSTPIASSAECALLQNYPNPFNPTTAISYTLPAASFVNLVVYDIAGRQIAELVNGWRDAGVHEVTWNASNFAAGVYIYHLTAGDYSASGKMALVK